MQALVIIINFWKESSFSEWEEVNYQESGNKPGSGAEQREGARGRLGTELLAAGTHSICHVKPCVSFCYTGVFFSPAEDLNKYFDFLLLPTITASSYLTYVFFPSENIQVSVGSILR